MRKLLLRPATQVIFVATGFLSAGLLTGIPLITKGAPVWLYYVLLVALVASQSGPLAAFFFTQRAIVGQLRVAGEEAIRNLVSSQIALDPVHGSSEADINWAVNIRDVDGRVLLSRRTDALKSSHFPALDASSTRIKIISAPLNSSNGSRGQTFGGCRTQAGTGFRFEVFYEIVNPMAVGEGSILGANLLAALIADHMVGFIANKLSPS